MVGLNFDPAGLAALYRIFDDKRHPFAGRIGET